MTDDAVRRVSALGTLFTPWALRAAVTLRLPDLVGDGITGLPELAVKSGSDPGALRRLLRYLVLLGVFRETGDDEYAPGELGDVLRHDHPARLALSYDQEEPFARRGDQVIPLLTEAVRTGRNVWETLAGQGFWADLAADPALSASFDLAMSAHADRIGPALAVAYDWPSVSSLVDVGGGTGRTLTAVVGAHPHLRGTLVDLPATVARAEPHERITVRGQSFFDPLPAGADAYLLANIIHDWNDEDAGKILRRCAEAAGAGGRILLAERVLDAAEADEFVAAQRDLAMLLLLDAKERTAAEFRALGATAGLALGSISPLVPGDGIFLLSYRAADAPAPR